MKFGLLFILALMLDFAFAQEIRNAHEIPHNETKSMNKQIVRSIGRDEAPPHAFPYIVVISKNYTFQCSGALITPQWVITTAIRVNGTDAGALRAHLGVHNFSKIEPTQQILSIDEVIIHGEWINPNFVVNNIALLRLNKEAVLNDYVKTVLLAPLNSPDYAGSSLQYAYFNSDVRLSNATVFGISSSVCENVGLVSYGEGVICVVNSEGAGECIANYGSLLINPDRGELVGLHSTCNGARPIEFTRISYFNEWIAGKIR